ncbi:MAG TPA: hypothetical protein VMQ76_00620 [Terracidiphilus sp.]|nr:hypothetical protein [Terracidiphilus sp.]
MDKSSDRCIVPSSQLAEGLKQTEHPEIRSGELMPMSINLT